MIEIDARGLACPEPVIQTKNCLEEKHPPVISVVVDNAAAQQNVQRFLESQGYQTSLEQKGIDHLIIGTTNDALPDDIPQMPEKKSSDGKKIMVMCSTDRMGFGDDDLGKKLMISFIRVVIHKLFNVFFIEIFKVKI